MPQRRSISHAFALSLVAVLTAAPPVVAQSTVTVSQPRLRISGDAPGGPLIGRMRSATLRADGGVVIADDAEDQLHWFDRTGRFQRSVGRDGSGPGEFRSVVWIGRCGTNEIAVFDQQQSRVSFYSAAGAYLRQQPNEAVLIFGCDANGSLVGANSAAIGRTEQRGGIVRYPGTGAAQPLASDQLLLQVMMLGARMRATVGAEAIVYGNGQSATVTLARPGTPSRTIPAGAPNRAPSDAQRTAAIEEYVHVFTGTSAEYDRLRTLYAKMPSATTLPAYNGLFLDNTTDVLWVERSLPGAGETLLERRTLAGTLTALVRIPRDLKLCDVHDGQLVAVFQDPDSGVEELQLYALPR